MEVKNEGFCTLSSIRGDHIDNMFYLLTQGGMMQFSYASLFNKKVHLLAPPTKASPHFCYNYFDDAFHGNAFFNSTEEKIRYESLGTGNFNRVFHAANRLQSLHKQPTEDSPVFSSTNKVVPNIDGWLQYLFQYDTVAPNPWQRYQSAPSSQRKKDLVQEVWKHRETQQFLMRDCLGPFISQDERLIAVEYENRYPQCMPATVLRNAEDSIYCIQLSAGTQEAKFQFMREVLTGHKNDAGNLPPCYHMFIIARDTLPVEILLPMIAKEFELDEKALRKEFDFSSFRAPAFSLYQDRPQCRIVTTSKFLHVSDDDRAYYWTPCGDVSFSPEMDAWLGLLKKEYQTILQSGENVLPAVEFALLLLDTLEDINHKYREIYAFKDMVDDYLQHLENREYQTAWSVLCRLAQYQGSDFIIYDGPWEFAPAEFRSHPTRLAIKRFLAILANRNLRREVFSF